MIQTVILLLAEVSCRLIVVSRLGGVALPLKPLTDGLHHGARVCHLLLPAEAPLLGPRVGIDKFRGVEQYIYTCEDCRSQWPCSLDQEI